MNVTDIIKDITSKNTINSVVWLAAGGSYGGFWGGNYFLLEESKTLRSENITSNEFVKAPPVFVGEHTIAIICSMRGTPETIEAARTAKKLGASTIGLYIEESELTKIVDHKIKYESVAIDESNFAKTNSAYGLLLAAEILNSIEGYNNYEVLISSMNEVDSIYRDAVKNIRKQAIKWSLKNKDSQNIYVMANGAAYGAAYVFSICNIMEMLQINSGTINSCDFFHGPFEVTNEQTSYFLLLSNGRGRSNDERAKKFLQEFGGDNVYTLDANDIGINKFNPAVSEYFNHVLYSPILNNVFMRELASVIKKDYMTRTYMWKAEY